MVRPALEVADILRDHGPAWREANQGHVSLEQLKVMSAIERCRTAALGGHVARCENTECGHTEISYNSCVMGNFRNGEPATASATNLALFKWRGVDRPAFYSPLQQLCAEIGRREIALRSDTRSSLRIVVDRKRETCDH
jgi:hypothetical protein